MARQIVPTVLTGDAWTAAQHNTYIKDNEAAHWPYTTAGDMPYAASSSTLSRLAIGAAQTLLRSTGSAPAWSTVASLLQLTAMVASQAAGDLLYANGGTTIARLPKGTAFQILRMNSGATAPEWGAIEGFVPFTDNKTNTSWDGDSHGTGTSTLSANTFNASIPSTASAILVSLSAQWGSAGGGNYVNITPSGETSNCLLVRGQTTFFQDNMGIVPLNSGSFDVIVAGASALVYIDIWGYLQ